MRQLTTDQVEMVSGGMMSAGTIFGIAELAFGIATADPILIVLGAGDLIAGQL